MDEKGLWMEDFLRVRTPQRRQRTEDRLTLNQSGRPRTERPRPLQGRIRMANGQNFLKANRGRRRMKADQVRPAIPRPIHIRHNPL